MFIMATPTNDQKDLNFRDVYLSDLSPIISLYRKTAVQHPHIAAADKLDVHFGLPLNVVEQNKKIVAYSFVSISETEQAEVRWRIDQEFKETSLETQLSDFAAKRYQAKAENQTGKDLSDPQSIRNSINRLVDWLNNCD
jgi:hypothetical protein